MGAYEQVRHLRSAAPAAAPGGPCPGPPPVPPRHRRPRAVRGEKAPKKGSGKLEAPGGLRRILRGVGAAVPTRDGQEVKGWKVMEQEGTGDDGLGEKGQEVMSRERMEQEMRCREVEDGEM